MGVCRAFARGAVSSGPGEPGERKVRMEADGGRDGENHRPELPLRRSRVLTMACGIEQQI